MNEIESLENWSSNPEEPSKVLRGKAGLVVVRPYERAVCEGGSVGGFRVKGIECHLLCEAAQVIVQENCGIKLLNLSSHIETLLARFLI